MTMISFAEEVASLYYQVKGYLIARNIQIQTEPDKNKKKKGWKDIDLLAYKKENGNNEVLIVSCKDDFRTEDDVKKAVGDFKFFKEKTEENPYSWLLKENEPKLVFFAEHKSQQKYCEENGYKYITINGAINEILKLKRFDVKGGSPIGKETEILPRILKHLKKYTHEEKIEW